MNSSLGFRAYASGPDAYAGTMNLSVGRSGNRSRPVRTESAGVLRLMKPLHLDDSGQVAYFVVNPGGAYFSEACRMDVEVLPGASLLLSSQGATRIYRTPRGPAVQEAAFTVGEGARLEYVPDQLIAYRDADYRQVTTITMAADAQVFVCVGGLDRRAQRPGAVRQRARPVGHDRAAPPEPASVLTQLTGCRAQRRSGPASGWPTSGSALVSARRRPARGCGARPQPAGTPRCAPG